MNLEEYRREKAEHDFLEDMYRQSLKTYCLYMKSHCAAPDIELYIEATSVEEAARLFKKENHCLIEFSAEELEAFIAEEEKEK